MLDTLAFVIWNVSARTPIEVARDAGRAFRHGRGLMPGFAALAGTIFIAAAAVLILPALADRAREFPSAELATLLLALALDSLIGEDLRAITRFPSDR